MTASRVLNNGAAVSETRRAAVLGAVAELGYQPNLAARALAGGGPIRIALLYANPSAAYLGEFLLGVLAETQLAHVQLVLVSYDGRRLEEVLTEMDADGVAGVLLPSDDARLLEAIKASPIKAVAVASGAPLPGIATVAIDNFAAARAMTKHILGLGHRRVGFIAGDPDQAASGERERGYRAAIAEDGLPIDEALVVSGRFSYHSGLIAAEALLALDDPPTAIFASNDDMAAAAVAAAHRRQLDVPADLTVCGFDDSAFARSMWPELTTVRQPIAEMAQALVRLLLEMLRGDGHGQHLTFEHAIIYRASDARLGEDRT